MGRLRFNRTSFVDNFCGDKKVHHGDDTIRCEVEDAEVTVELDSEDDRIYLRVNGDRVDTELAGNTDEVWESFHLK